MPRNKNSKRVDPLRANKKTSRIEKKPPRPKHRNFHALPSWYHRVLGFSYTGERDAQPWDFDEDISDLGEKEDKEDSDAEDYDESEEVKEECTECDGEDSDCECQNYDSEMDEEEEEDSESERSYVGSDADYYYELKEMRDKRKREIREEELAEEKEREEDLENERAREKEILDAIIAAQKNNSVKKKKKGGGSSSSSSSKKTTKLDPLPGKEFKLFSSGYMDTFDSFNEDKNVEFYHHRSQYDSDDDSDDADDEPIRNNKQEPGGSAAADLDVYGDISLGSKGSCQFGPFRPANPDRSGKATVTVKTKDGRHELTFKFFGNEHLELELTKEFVMARCDPEDRDLEVDVDSLPDVFKFVGVKRDREKEEAEHAAKRAAARSPSPRETWFEMNHPMGWWNQQRYHGF